MRRTRSQQLSRHAFSRRASRSPGRLSSISLHSLFSELRSQKRSAATWSTSRRFQPRRSTVCAACAALSGDHLESDHLVSRPADIEFACSRRCLRRVGVHLVCLALRVYADVETVLKAEGWIKTLTFIVLSPLIGMTLGFTLMVIVYWIFHRVSVNRVDRVFRVGQLFLGGGVFARPRRKRRPKNDGDHHDRRSSRAVSTDDVRRQTAGHSALGRARGSRGDRLGHALGRLANRQNDGNEDRKTAARRRILCRNSRCDDTVSARRILAFPFRRRTRSPDRSSASDRQSDFPPSNGASPADRLGVGSHDPRGCYDRVCKLLNSSRI